MKDGHAYHICDLLNPEKDIVYEIPYYQREYTWGKTECDAFFDDIYNNDRGYFLGSIICINRTKRPLDKQEWELVDGQQRMITLSLLYAAIYAKLGSSLFNWKEIPGNDEERFKDFLKNKYGKEWSSNPKIEKIDYGRTIRVSAGEQTLSLKLDENCTELTSDIDDRIKDTFKPKIENNKINIYLKLNRDQEDDLSYLRHKLILKKAKNELRLIPQKQNENDSDYMAVLSEAKITEKPCYRKDNAGNRRIYRAYRHFLNRVELLYQQYDVNDVFSLVGKLNDAIMVMIEAEDHSDAYMLFESLNHRGAPLTAIDIIKNKLLSKLADLDSGNKVDHSEDWNRLLNYLGDDNIIQERFFRQYYNCMKRPSKSPIATRSNTIKLYEKIIDIEATTFLRDILEAGKIYSLFINPKEINEDQYRSLIRPLENLSYIQGTPSYLILMYLFARKDKFGLEMKNFCDIINNLVSFFVKRNLTDIPSTNKITPLLINIIDELNDRKGDEVVKMIRDNLNSHLNESIFLEKLNGKIYGENYNAVRFILCAIEESYYTEREQCQNLWLKDNHGKYILTIEHILPQGNLRNKDWVKMISEEADEDEAKKFQEEYADKLGNLTLTGYNSKLSDMSFIDKRDRIDEGGNNVGYKNNLRLNDGIRYENNLDSNSVAKERSEWKKKDIEERTNNLIKRVCSIFSSPISNP